MTITPLFRCHKDDKLGVVSNYQDVDNGEVTLMFNGKPVKANRNFRVGGKRGWIYVGRTGLKSMAGENKIKIIFKRGVQSMAAKASVTIKITDTRPQFTECEDKVNGPPLLFSTRPTFDLTGYLLSAEGLPGEERCVHR